MFDITKLFVSPEKAIKDIVAFNTEVAQTVYNAQSKLAYDLYDKWTKAFAINK